MNRQNFQEQLSEKLMGTFDAVINDRKKHYQNNSKPTVERVSKLISNTSYTNAAIAGGAALIPGPAGMVSIIPEIVLTTRNQIQMVYDIGAAYGQEKVLTREVIASIVLSSMGQSGIGLLTLQGGKYLVKRASLRFFQKIVNALAGKITQRVLRSAISRYLPGLGAAAMAAWTKYSTGQVGKKAVEVFSKPIYTEEVEEDIKAEDATIMDEQLQDKFDEQKILALINLMKVDGRIHEKELEYIDELISNSSFSDNKKRELKQKTESNTNNAVDYAVFDAQPDEKIGLIMDMVALAKRDGEFHVTEKMMVKEVGKKIGFDPGDIEELMQN